MNNALNQEIKEYIQDLIRFCILNISSILGYNTKYDIALDLTKNLNHINFKYIGDDNKVRLQKMIVSAGDENDLPSDKFFWKLLNTYKKLFYIFNNAKQDTSSSIAQIESLARYVYAYEYKDVLKINKFSDVQIRSAIDEMQSERLSVIMPFISSDMLNSIHNIIRFYSNKIKYKSMNRAEESVEIITEMISKDIIYKGKGGITYPYAIKPHECNVSFILVPEYIIEEKTSTILSMKRELEYILDHILCPKLLYFIRGELSNSEVFALWTKNTDYFPVSTSSPQKFKMIENIANKYFTKEIAVLERNKNRSNDKDGYFSNFTAIREILTQNESTRGIYEMIESGELFDNWRMPASSQNALISSKLKELEDNEAKFWVFTKDIEINNIDLLFTDPDIKDQEEFDPQTLEEALEGLSTLMEKANKTVDIVNKVIEEAKENIEKEKKALKRFKKMKKTEAKTEEISEYIENYINTLPNPEYDFCRYF